MESIGSKLKQARQSKGISIEQAQKDTRIHSGILLALENDRIEEIVSGPIYVRSFLKKYADYLGLDGASLSAAYSAHKPDFKEQISALKNREASIDFPVKKILTVIAVIIVAFIGIKILFFAGSKVKIWFKSRPKAVRKAEIPKPRTFRKEVPQAAAAVPKPAAVNPAPQIPIGEDLILSIKARSDVYLKVKADGSVMYDDVLKKGSIDKWRAKESLEISTSKAEALTAELNGRPLGPLGKGVAKGIVITKTGLKLPK